MSEPSKASTDDSAKSPPDQSSTPKGERSASNATVPTGAASTAKNANGSAPDANLRDASYDWILKPSGFKGTHNLVWPIHLTALLLLPSLQAWTIWEQR